MVLIKEFRIPMPLTVEEYHVAQLYATAEVSKQETKGDAGVEILVNEPYDDGKSKGQYTKKVYHLSGHIPKFLTAILPQSALKLEEEAWNGYPHCKTVLTNPFLGERFHLIVESIHLPDKGTTENAHGIDEKALKLREIVPIDIANDTVDEKDYKPEYDPRIFRSEKSGRGPLKDNWIDSSDPVMCCYKLVTLKFHVFGAQSAVESFFGPFQRKLFLLFNRQVFCLIDQWFGMTMEDIRELEAKAKAELDEKVKNLPTNHHQGRKSSKEK